MKSDRPHPIYVEVLGVAGSGKSSLAKALANSGHIQPPFIGVSNPRHLVVVLRVLPLLWPLLVSNLTRSPRMTWPDFKLMAYVTGWREFLRGQPEYGDSTLVLDQGPLYALGRLEAKELGVASTPRFRVWWDEMLSAWAGEISLIVWLDAANDQLIQRINRRPQDHTIKGVSTDEANRFLDHYRKVFTRLLKRVEELGGGDVVRVDTTNLDPDELVEQVQDLIRGS